MVDCLHSKPLAIVICILACFGGVETTWWFLSQLQLSAVGARVVCDNIPGLARRQRHLCQKNPDVMISISRGARSGVSECQFQFRDQRWNCSTVERDSSVYGKLMLKLGSREAAFVYAVSSAGVVHSITRSCSKGELLNCACDPTKKGMHRDARGEFSWGGCSEYVGYGNIFSRKFIDAREKRVRDARALMNLHNNRAGRKAVQKHVKLECKCHGVSGSCTVRTCWLAMMDFRRVGNYLKHKYDGATEVTMNQAGTGIVVANRHHKRPTRTDLVYFEASPDYCVSDAETGSLGTADRKCNKTSMGTDGCDIMCCGRGYDTSRVLRVHKCECKFQWCCYVRCQQCKEWIEEYTCKSPKSRFALNNAETPDAVGHFRLRQKNTTKWRRTTSTSIGDGQQNNRSITSSTDSTQKLSASATSLRVSTAGRNVMSTPSTPKR